MENTAFVLVHPRSGSTLVTAAVSYGAVLCMEWGLLGETPDITGGESVEDLLLPCTELAATDLSPSPSRETCLCIAAKVKGFQYQAWVFAPLQRTQHPVHLRWLLSLCSDKLGRREEGRTAASD